MPRKYRPSPHPSLPCEETTPIVRLWLLRILQLLGGHKEWIQGNGFHSDALAIALGLDHWLNENERAFDAKAVRQELRQLHLQAEQQAAHTPLPPHLRANVAQLATLADLSDVDCRILEFACCIHAEQLLDDTADRLGEMSSARVCSSLAVILDIPPEQVRSALAPQGVLARSGLVMLDRNGRGWLRSRLDLLSGSFPDVMLSGTADLLRLLRGKVCPANTGHLKLADYAHIQPQLDIALSNSGALDAAFIRRFDMVFELPVPPRKQRQRIVQQHCDGLLDSKAIARLSEAGQLAPAVVARAAQVVRSIQGTLDAQQTDQALERLVNNTLHAQGHSPIRRFDPARLPEVYDPAFIHADVDLAALAQGIGRTRSARLCLYGPPGTGKTAYGRWLAQELQMPLLVKRASDLQSMWVGECEKNIARAFHEAEQDGALLLIDEVDSFLQDRRGAARSWEVSQVNEMLTQMEAFAGVFIASTNLIKGLDAASLRRFDLKVRLDYLREPQAWELFQRHCIHLQLPAPGPTEKARLSRLHQLTPGDFAAVLRQSRFKPLNSTAAVVEALELECALKESSKKTIGFM